jgi:hypothetical protein
VRELSALLDGHEARAGAAAEEAEIPQDLVGQLRALGYLDP